MKRLGIVVAFVACASALGACKMIEQLKKSGQAAGLGASSAAAPSAPTAQDDKDSQLNEKLEGYIYCMNYETRRVYSSRESYLERVDEQKGPTGKETYIYVQDVGADACIKRVDESKAKPPAMADLDAAATDYKTTLGEVDKLTTTAHAYYDQKDFKDDNYAKAKTMHKPLLDAFAAFEKADKVFEAKVTALNEGISQRRLARLKNDPTAQLEYGIAKSVDDAKKLVKFAEVESLEKVDGAGLTAALTSYEQSLASMNTYIDAHKPEADKVTMLSSFTSGSAAYLKAAKELMRRKRDNKGFKGESGNPENIDGHPAQVLAKYNDMINDSNNLRFR